ncbi:MAG: hypothetical protein AVDCRST_MAG03-12 [uncultured Rubrobacteraceae bacterium]|uniref:2'-5' RNA ligase family protein n=1 Tax=uncultured Rubrobacteraceae bacterium TaxID=349277 RepID=A0A6J4NG97_9ACTN|nr:MAG: hypothetical protein AVDCRST_MAG03-12 [uncultured Rubrobacteraceae bacterium]
MALVVVNYPTVSRDDYDWMQSIRAEHDELYYGVADPHFTFVFPVFGFDREPFLEHVRERARGVEEIPFACRCATVVKDATNEYTHVFLVPDEGHSGIVKLHDRLYGGPLSPHLRLDIPFIPHVAVANSTDATACKRLADGLNREGFEVEGSVDALDAASYEHNRVTTIERVPLGGP